MGSVPHFDHIHDDIHEPLSPSFARNTTGPIVPPEQNHDAIRLAVVGGGIGGLCLALGLLQHRHLDVQVYEAAHKFSEIGAGIGVGPNAERALEMLGPKIFAAYARQSTRCPFRLCNGLEGKDAGKVLMPENSNASQATVHRAHFLDELVALMPRERSHFGKRLEHLDDKTAEGGCFTLHFKDGTTAEADAVIGADGVHSSTREYVLCEEENPDAYKPTYSGATCYRNLIPMEIAIEALGADVVQNSSIYMLDKSEIMSFPVDHNQRLNVVAYTWNYAEWTKEKWVIPATTAEVVASCHGQAGVLTKMLELFDQASAWALWDLPSLPRYNRNRVCIIGDAAHATTPFQGQGAGQAIEDALTVVELMREVKTADDIPFAFAAYDTVRRPRGNKIVTTSRKAGLILSMQDAEHQDMTEVGYGFPARMKWIWTNDLTEQCQHAAALFKEYKTKA